MTQEPTPRRAAHLIDPDAPRKQSTPEDRARLERVQRTVMSVLVGTTIFHLSIGMVIGAAFIDDSERVAQVGLCLLGGAFGVIAVMAAFAIHRQAFTPAKLGIALAIGSIPTLVGLYVIVLS
ncbi:MAG: hypothetical protein WB471_00455 [Nocardioides sp.]